MHVFTTRSKNFDVSSAVHGLMGQENFIEKVVRFRNDE